MAEAASALEPGRELDGHGATSRALRPCQFCSGAVGPAPLHPPHLEQQSLANLKSMVSARFCYHKATAPALCLYLSL